MAQRAISFGNQKVRGLMKRQRMALLQPGALIQYRGDVLRVVTLDALRSHPTAVMIREFHAVDVASPNCTASGLLNDCRFVAWEG